MKYFSVLTAAVLMTAGCFLMSPLSAQTAAAPETPAVAPAAQVPVQKQAAPVSCKWCSEVVLYVPNRIMDAFDIFSVNLKFGLNFGVSCNITQAFGFGAEYGPTVLLCKDFNRQYGCAVQEGGFIQVPFLKYEDTRRIAGTGNVQEFWQFGSNFPTPAEGIFVNNIRDYWAISCSASCLAGFDVSIHPLQIAEFICGIFFLDTLLPEPPFIHDSIMLNPMVF